MKSDVMNDRNVILDPIFYAIADVHGNASALTAILEVIPSRATIICAGDLLGYNLDCNEVCEILRNRGVVCIKGNHDMYVLGELDYQRDRESSYKVIETRSRLSLSNRQWLASLPEKLSFEHDMPCYSPQEGSLKARNQREFTHVFHGSWRSAEEYVYPDTKIPESVPSGVTILGHTHHPMLRYHRAGVVLNPGSVGQPRDGHASGSFARIDLHRAEFCFRRIPYGG